MPLAGPARRALPVAAPAALAGARPVPYWLDQPGRPAPEPPLNRATAAGLAVIGGGFTGLWTALLAKERDPAADVVLLEGAVTWADAQIGNARRACPATQRAAEAGPTLRPPGSA